MKLEFSRQILGKSSNIKLNQNPSSGSRVVPCGRTDMTELLVAFRNVANAPKTVDRVNHYLFRNTTIFLNLEPTRRVFLIRVGN